MKEKIKNWLLTITFLGIVFGFGISVLLLPDTEISVSERRKLKQLPNINMQTIADGTVFDEIENYLQDQFPLRDSLRSVKSICEYYVLHKADNNDIYIYDGFVCKQDYPLDQEAVEEAADKINEIYEELFDGCNAYYSIIPDKNYFLATTSGHLSYDYNDLYCSMQNGVDDKISYIDITSMLSIEQYYKTDLHWRQEKIIPIADKLLTGMNKLQIERHYDEYTLQPFYGSYFGQAALPIASDSLVYLNNEVLNSCSVYNPIKDTYGKIYDVSQFDGIDPYDVFVSGAESILTITNPSNATGKELYIIRDSFSSSLAPLLIENYSKIILIDPRYISIDVASKYISPAEDASVLFLFSTTILNKGYLFR